MFHGPVVDGKGIEMMANSRLHQCCSSTSNIESVRASGERCDGSHVHSSFNSGIGSRIRTSAFEWIGALLLAGFVFFDVLSSAWRALAGGGW